MIYTIASAIEDIDRSKLHLAAYHCQDCNMEFASNKENGYTPSCMSCGSDNITASEAKVPTIAGSDDELSSIACPSCKTKNVIADANVPLIDGKLHCVTCSTAMYFSTETATPQSAPIPKGVRKYAPDKEIEKVAPATPGALPIDPKDPYNMQGKEGWAREKDPNSKAAEGLQKTLGTTEEADTHDNVESPKETQITKEGTEKFALKPEDKDTGGLTRRDIDAKDPADLAKGPNLKNDAVKKEAQDVTVIAKETAPGELEPPVVTNEKPEDMTYEATDKNSAEPVTAPIKGDNAENRAGRKNASQKQYERNPDHALKMDPNRKGSPGTNASDPKLTNAKAEETATDGEGDFDEHALQNMKDPALDTHDTDQALEPSESSEEVYSHGEGTDRGVDGGDEIEGDDFSMDQHRAGAESDTGMENRDIVEMSLLDIQTANTKAPQELTLTHFGEYIVASIDNVPVATLNKADAGENADVFMNKPFLNAIVSSAEKIGNVKTLEGFEFTPIIVDFPQAASVQERIDAATWEYAEAMKEETSAVKDVIFQCLAIAAAGMSKNFFRGKSNILKAKLYDELDNVNVRNPHKLIDKVFASVGDEYNKTLLELAMELMDKKPEVRAELADAIGNVNYREVELAKEEGSGEDSSTEDSEETACEAGSIIARASLRPINAGGEEIVTAATIRADVISIRNSVKGSLFQKQQIAS